VVAGGAVVVAVPVVEADAAASSFFMLSMRVRCVSASAGFARSRYTSSARIASALLPLSSYAREMMMSSSCFWQSEE
jgi:hypothetical protein